MSNSIKDSVQAFAVNQVLKYVDSNPQEAFPKLLDWADKFDKDNLYLTPVSYTHLDVYKRQERYHLHRKRLLHCG